MTGLPEPLPNPWTPTTTHYFWNRVQVNPKAVSTLEFWVKDGHKVYLVTASYFNDTLGYKIRKTLEAFNPELINERNVIVAQDKSAIMGDIMIDDCIDNLKKFDGVRICFKQPWNQEGQEHTNLRSESWYCIDSYIYSYLK